MCKIGMNKTLAKLLQLLGIPARCHGRRRECIRRLQENADDLVMGAAGAAIGYCQALFANAGDPHKHTRKVQRLLREIQAPWCDSHELQWGYRLASNAANYVSGACAPLLGIGRVPILITSLDPARDHRELHSILATSPSVPETESILVRIVLNDANSVRAVCKILKALLAEARDKRQMPKWWPLIQGTISATEWRALRETMGTEWEYVNVAVNPFTPDDVFEEVANQITVAQIPVGRADGVHSDSAVQLCPDVKILGSSANGVYFLTDFADKLRRLPVVPTLIVLGPSQQDWSDKDNQARIAALLPLVRQTCDRLWDELTQKRREEIWQLAA